MALLKLILNQRKIDLRSPARSQSSAAKSAVSAWECGLVARPSRFSQLASLAVGGIEFVPSGGKIRVRGR
jgi:hypothetical protein